MRKSIIKKTLLIVFAVLLLTDALLFALANGVVKSLVEKNLYAVTRATAESVSQMLHGIPMEELAEGSGEYQRYYESFEELCYVNELLYIYVYVPDMEKNEITFVMTVCGRNGAQSAKTKRTPGTVVTHEFGEAELAAIHKTESSVFEETNNEFGDVLTCYQPVCDASGNVVAIVGVDQEYSKFASLTALLFLRILVGMVVSIIIIMVALYIIFKVKLLRPAELISRKMQSFVHDRSHGEDERLVIKGKDEFANMAESFNKMTDEINEYITNIEKLTQEKQRQLAQIEIAADIQKGMLPPEHFETDALRIEAVMRPAKHVGGDFYDYFETDGEHIFTVVADVSGKGIAGALLMSKAITATKQSADFGHSPAQILEDVNNLIAENNPQMMFITAFIGVYDKTGHTYTYANAGHNPPFYMSKSNRANRLDDGHGVALGLFEGEKYTEHIVTLEAGDTVFLFTDGVSEAVSEKREFFGEERIGQNLCMSMEKKELSCMEAVLSDLNEFQGAAEQFDDITMMAVTVRHKEDLHLEADVKNLDLIFKIIMGCADLPPGLKRRLCLVAEELFVNICSYAYGEKKGSVFFSLSVDDEVVMRFVDGGKPYDPFKERLEIENYDMETQIGGLGKFLTLEIADKADYEYKDSKNVVTIHINIMEET